MTNRKGSHLRILLNDEVADLTSPPASAEIVTLSDVLQI
jgi:hypothetical protein